MAEQTLGTKREFRREVFSFLELLSGRIESSGSIRTLPAPDGHENGERAKRDVLYLARLWFEDIYVLGRAYLDAEKGDYSEQAASEFRKSFSLAELEVLERFHRFFELRISMAKASPEGLEGLPNSLFWEHICRDARNTLYLMDIAGQRESE